MLLEEDDMMVVANQNIDLILLYMEESLDIDPMCGNCLGDALCHLKRFDEAEPVLKKMIQDFVDDPDHQEDVLSATRILVGLHQKQGQELRQKSDKFKQSHKDESRTLSEQGHKQYAKAEAMSRKSLKRRSKKS